MALKRRAKVAVQPGPAGPRRKDTGDSTHGRGGASSHRYVTLLGLKDVAAGTELVDQVREGLPYRAFDEFIVNTTLTPADAANLVDIPTRTLARRKSEGRFHPEESDRLLRASRVLNRAIELFEGDRAEATHWLSRPAKALDGAAPIDLARTEVGALEVEHLIDKLEHGTVI